jgi:hypothetical protein
VPISVVQRDIGWEGRRVPPPKKKGKGSGMKAGKGGSQVKKLSHTASPMEGKKERSKAKATKPKPQPSQRKPLLPQNVAEEGKEGRKKKRSRGKKGTRGRSPLSLNPPN